MSRTLALVTCLVVAAAWPLRDALSTGRMVGAGPDVVVTLWAMWWFAVEGVRTLWDGAATLANHPYGAAGGVLAPLSTLVFAAVRAVAGDAWAGSVLGLATLVGLAGATAWTARGLGLGWAAALAGGLSVLVARYPLFALGETSVVGITAVPAVVGLGAWVRRRPALTAVCAGLVALEYPYLTPLLPGLALLRAGRERSPEWGRVAVAATLLTVLGTMFVGRGQVESFSQPLQPYLAFLGRAWPAIEEAQARAQPALLLWPGEVRWSLAAHESVLARGRDYLGVSVVLLGVLGGRRALPWLGLGALAVLVALGSDYGGVPGLFSFVNLLAREVVRPLTQPTRFLLLANVAFAVAAAVGVERLGRWGAIGLLALLVDGFVAGGLSLRLPTVELPGATCVAELRGREGVVVWPWDALGSPDGNLRVRLWQMEHQQPGSTFGVGSWTLGQGTRAKDALRRAGLREDRDVPTPALLALRYDTLVVDLSATERAPRGVGGPVARCEGAEVYFLR